MYVSIKTEQFSYKGACGIIQKEMAWAINIFGLLTLYAPYNITFAVPGF